MLNYGIIAALFGMLVYALGDTLSKRITMKLGHHESALLIVGASLIPLFLSFLVIQPNVIDTSLVIVSVISGIFLALGFLLVYKTLETEQVANTMVLLNIEFIVVVLFGIFALSEALPPLEMAALVTIFIGAFLVSLSKSMKFNRKMIPAVIGNVFWGLSFVVVAPYVYTDHSASTAFFFVARLSAFIGLLIYLLVLARVRKASLFAHNVNKKEYLLTGFTGILDGLGQGSLVFLVIYNVAALGGAILAIEPAVVAMLGFLLYKERLTHLQFAGMLIALLGGVAIGLV